MLRKLAPRSIYDVMAAVGCFAALATGSAYAANTVFSADIADGEVKAADVAANAIDSARVRDNTLNTFDVHSFIGDDVIDGTLTGADVADQSLTGVDIQDDSVLGYPDIVDGSLDDVDIAEFAGAARNFTTSIGVVPAHSCLNISLNGLAAARDHLLLTPNYNTTSSFLSYTAEWKDSPTESADLKVCNPTSVAIDDQTTRFNLIVISATT